MALTSYELWAWARFLVALDAAGWVLVRKPELLHRGLTKP